MVKGYSFSMLVRVGAPVVFGAVFAGDPAFGRDWAVADLAEAEQFVFALKAFAQAVFLDRGGDSVPYV